jgi:GT2 family glycosyltransferase
MYAEEVDWCYTMQRAGWEVWYQPEARILHHGGGSSRHRRTQREADLYRSRVRFFRKNYGNGSALALKSLMYVLTTVKFLVHGTLRVLSGNRKGRPVVSLSDLHTALRGV